MRELNIVWVIEWNVFSRKKNVESIIKFIKIFELRGLVTKLSMGYTLKLFRVVKDKLHRYPILQFSTTTYWGPRWTNLIYYYFKKCMQVYSKDFGVSFRWYILIIKIEDSLDYYILTSLFAQSTAWISIFFLTLCCYLT
jgi:hypothetical protein